MFRPTFWPSSVTIENNRNTHELLKYDVAVTKLSVCFYCNLYQ